MSSNHQSLGSPVSPLSSRENSFSPSSQYRSPSTAPQHHKNSSPPTQAVSPLSAQFPDSPTTRSYLSPVSIVSPELSFPPELLHHDHHRAPPTAPEVPPTVHLARLGTLHLQDHMPFKQPARITATSTRFPSRKPVNESHNRPAAGNYSKDKEDSGPSRSSFFSSSERPITTYLADHQPHRLAAAPPPPTTTARPNPNPDPNNSIKPTLQTQSPQPPHRSQGPTFHSMNLQDIELGDLTSTTSTTTAAKPATVPPTIMPCASESESESSSEDAAERTKRYEIKRRRLRNCIIGCVLCPALVGMIVVFAVLVIRANE